LASAFCVHVGSIAGGLMPLVIMICGYSGMGLAMAC
jgi:hypothetical protein